MALYKFQKKILSTNLKNEVSHLPDCSHVVSPLVRNYITFIISRLLNNYLERNCELLPYNR